MFRTLQARTAFYALYLPLTNARFEHSAFAARKKAIAVVSSTDRACVLYQPLSGS